MKKVNKKSCPACGGMGIVRKKIKLERGTYIFRRVSCKCLGKKTK